MKIPMIYLFMKFDYKTLKRLLFFWQIWTQGFNFQLNNFQNIRNCGSVHNTVNAKKIKKLIKTKKMKYVLNHKTYSMKPQLTYFTLQFIFFSMIRIYYQKQPPEVFYEKKVFLEISQNSQENTCSTASFLIKLQVSDL